MTDIQLTSKHGRKKIAFFDGSRDGVINENGAGYTYKIEDFILIPDCITLMQNLLALNYELIIITNQSGIGRGYYTEAAYQQLTQWYRNQLVKHGIRLLDIFHCPHHPDAQCDCRKPKSRPLPTSSKKTRYRF